MLHAYKKKQQVRHIRNAYTADSTPRVGMDHLDWAKEIPMPLYNLTNPNLGITREVI